jgi:hypothetical protein
MRRSECKTVQCFRCSFIPGFPKCASVIHSVVYICSFCVNRTEKSPGMG